MNMKLFSLLFLSLNILFLFPLEMSMVFAENHEDSSAPSFETRENIQGVCGGPINVKDSIVLSVVTLCLPGILEKTQEYRQLKCEKAVCYYEAVKNGLDPSFCERQYAYRTCTYIVGEAFAVPPLAMVEYWRNMVAQALANPAGYLISFATLEARATVTASCMGPEASGTTCNVVSNPMLLTSTILLIAVDTASIVQYFKDFAENGFDSLSGNRGPDYCEQLPEIREEMEEILSAKNG